MVSALWGVGYLKAFGVCKENRQRTESSHLILMRRKNSI